METSLAARFRTMLSASYVDEWFMLRNIVRVCKEMLTDRGCATVEQTIHDVHSVVESETGCEPVVVGGPSPHVKIFFVGEDRVSVKTMRTVMDAHEADTFVFLSFEGPTTFAKKEAQMNWSNAVQFFRYRDVCVNITHHHLVAKHSRCDDADRHASEKHNYPKILPSDPVCQYYDFRVGDVIRISRTRGGSNPFDHFRVVAL